MSEERDLQRRVARIALEAAGEDSGFALAGSGAIREHGLISRPTEDVDLFTVQSAASAFGPALDRIIAALTTVGYVVEVRRRLAMFAQFTATDEHGRSTGLDLGVDWRAHLPVRLKIGPVLSLEDAVANKIGALFSRSETRDYLDVDAIRRTERYSDVELIELARRSDAGFDLEWFAKALENVERIDAAEVRVYGVTPEQLDSVKNRLTAWAASIRAAERREETRTDSAEAADRRPPRADDD